LAEVRAWPVPLKPSPEAPEELGLIADVGGRKAGTPNRKTQEISEPSESLGHNPIEAMVQIATDPNASLELRGRRNAELAHYVYPKRKAVEVKPDQANPHI
jgi:hypothetical protein